MLTDTQAAGVERWYRRQQAITPKDETMELPVHCPVTCASYTPRSCSIAHPCQLSQGHDGLHRFETHGPAARFTAHDLAAIRAAILRVIDDGDTVTSIAPHPWDFYNHIEPVANQQRLDFCDAVAARLIEEAKG